jgi:hypothetical protein
MQDTASLRVDSCALRSFANGHLAPCRQTVDFTGASFLQISLDQILKVCYVLRFRVRCCSLIRATNHR